MTKSGIPSLIYDLLVGITRHIKPYQLKKAAHAVASLAYTSNSNDYFIGAEGVFLLFFIPSSLLFPEILMTAFQIVFHFHFNTLVVRVEIATLGEDQKNHD